MNKTEIHTLIGELQHLAEQADMAAKKWRQDKANLEAQLAEAEKPKLRHGDYGLTNQGKPFFYIDVTWDKDHAYFANGTHASDFTTCELGKEQSDCAIFLGNLADLKTMAEPLENFELYGTYIKAQISGRDIAITDCKETSYLTPTQVREYAHKLLRLACTAERTKDDK